MFFNTRLLSVKGSLSAAQQFSLVVLCSVLMACGGGDSDPVDTSTSADQSTAQPVTDTPAVEEPVT